ncbi:hypothetical protein [Nocardiopsis ansamitocini]|nr:hypothetical protein [Nocardiopsis ansamitocini]
MGMPSLAGSGQHIDYGRNDVLWLSALRSLDARLQECGLETSLDGQIGAIDATLRDPSSIWGVPLRTQRTVLRPHRGRLWWWLRASHEEPAVPFMSPLTPAVNSSAAARRILGVLTPRAN